MSDVVDPHGGHCVLISPYGDVSSLGIRILSSCLKQAGFSTTKLFLTLDKEMGDIPPGLVTYDERLLREIGELCQGSLLVGISVMTNYFDRAVQLAAFLRREVGVEVVLGGVHASLMPRECAEMADYVCVGESEEAVVDLARSLADGRFPSGIPNVCYKRDGEVVMNPPRPLIQDLDQLPFQDYSLDDDYAVFEGVLTKLDLRGLEHLMTTGPGRGLAGNRAYYFTMMTRGCPYSCTYCCNRSVRQLYPGQNYLRRRSVDNFIGELSWVRKNLGFVNLLVIADDSFFDASDGEIEEFCRRFKTEIGIPFFSLGTPFGITEKKLSMMTDAGMVFVQVGIQTGSRRTQKMYKRPFDNQRMLKITDLLNRYTDRIRVHYDLILDNPMETDEDILETIRMLLMVKKPYHIQFFSLTLFPGTELASLAVERGLIEDWKSQVYRKQQFRKGRTYLNFVISLFNLPVPKWVIRLLISKFSLLTFNRPYFGRVLRLVFRA